MVICSLNNKNFPGALLNDAHDSALVNTMHKPLCEPHIENNVNQCVTGLREPMHRHITQ